MIRHHGLEAFAFTAPTALPLLKQTIRERGLFPVTAQRIKQFRHPPEDYHLISRRFPIFAVADGVTLDHADDGSYPTPSGAALAAKRFCQAAVQSAEQRYHNFSTHSLRPVFTAANAAVGAVNRAHGRSRKTSDFWHHDLYATTGAFAVVRGATAYWATICDSFVAHARRDRKLRIISPAGWPNRQRELPSGWERLSWRQQRREIRRRFRNAGVRRGHVRGYGVATGEAVALQYLNTGSLRIRSGDCLLLLTDGFAAYVGLPACAQLFHRWPPNINALLHRIDQRQAKLDPQRFGFERTVVACRILEIVSGK